MFELGKVDHWWPISRRFPVVAGAQTSGLKMLGYAIALDHIERSKPERVLEFGHSVTTPVFKMFGGTSEIWGLDSVAGAQYNNVRAMEEFRASHPNSTFVDGLFGTETDEQLPDASFDYIFSISTVEHIPESVLPQMFRTISRILKPGGIFYSSYDVFWGQPVRPMFDAIEGAGLEWVNDRASMDVFWCKWLRDFSPEDQLKIIRDVLFEDGRRIMEGYLQYVPEPQRKWIHQAMTILVGARRPA